MNLDPCPNCGKNTMPRIGPGDIANAARCQNPECGFVFERVTTGAGGLTAVQLDTVVLQEPEREQ